MGPSSLRVVQSYQEAGLVVDSPEPPDFLATELEFLYFLAEREENGTEAEAAPARTVFFTELLLPWMAPFCQRLTAATPHPFYGWAAALLLAFCRQEEERLSTATVPSSRPVTRFPANPQQNVSCNNLFQPSYHKTAEKNGGSPPVLKQDVSILPPLFPFAIKVL